jgi:hypothetical protein
VASEAQAQGGHGATQEALEVLVGSTSGAFHYGLLAGLNEEPAHCIKAEKSAVPVGFY